MGGAWAIALEGKDIFKLSHQLSEGGNPVQCPSVLTALKQTPLELETTLLAQLKILKSMKPLLQSGYKNIFCPPQPAECALLSYS
jgi:hypothetical protein